MKLTAQNLACLKGNLPLFKNISFELNNGEILQIEGENGAGKSTLLRIVMGVTPCDCGCVLWNNIPIQQNENYQQNIAYIGHSNAIKMDFSPLENLKDHLKMAGIQFNLQKTQEVLNVLGLFSKQHLPCFVLSQGQKRRVALSLLSLNDKPLWILDEPFVALDCQALSWLVETMNRHVQKGNMIIFTSHQKVTGFQQNPRRLLLQSAD